MKNGQKFKVTPDHENKAIKVQNGCLIHVTERTRRGNGDGFIFFHRWVV